MTETVKRRRWLWLVLAALALLIGGSIAGPFRPLNAEERRLIGTWGSESHRAEGIYKFTSDRRFAFIVARPLRPLTGSWSMSNGRLVYHVNSRTGSLSSRVGGFVRDLWQGFPNRHHWSIVFESDDRMQVSFGSGTATVSGRFDRRPASTAVAR